MCEDKQTSFGDTGRNDRHWMNLCPSRFSFDSLSLEYHHRHSLPPAAEPNEANEEHIPLLYLCSFHWFVWCLQQKLRKHTDALVKHGVITSFVITSQPTGRLKNQEEQKRIDGRIDSHGDFFRISLKSNDRSDRREFQVPHQTGIQEVMFVLPGDEEESTGILFALQPVFSLLEIPFLSCFFFSSFKTNMQSSFVLTYTSFVLYLDILPVFLSPQDTSCERSSKLHLIICLKLLFAPFLFLDSFTETSLVKKRSPRSPQHQALTLESLVNDNDLVSICDLNIFIPRLEFDDDLPKLYSLHSITFII